MKNYLAAFTLAALFLFSMGADSFRHGEFRYATTTQVWNKNTQSWMAPEEFWRIYATGRGGLTWGIGKEFPVYSQVKEHDTLIIKLDSGECLMEFFHTRWRRANDVRRWDPAFNQYGSCPYVFD